MLKNLLGLLLFGVILAIIALNFKVLLIFGQAQLAHNAAKPAVSVGNWEKAIQVYESALKEYPNNARIALELGRFYRKNNQQERAEGVYKSIIEAQPDNVEARVSLASLIKDDPNRINEAVDIYRAALKANPHDAHLLTQIGNLYKEAAENPKEGRESTKTWLYDQARYYYQLSLKLNPKQFNTHFNLGVAHQNMKNLQPAAKSYCQALLLKQDSPEAHFNLGLVLSELNYLDEAYRQMDTAVQLSSAKNMETAMEIARRVQNVKNDIYNSTQHHGLNKRPDPEFLDPACLSSHHKADAEKSH